MKEREYLVNLNDFKFFGLDELYFKFVERNCRCSFKDTIGNF